MFNYQSGEPAIAAAEIENRAWRARQHSYQYVLARDAWKFTDPVQIPINLLGVSPRGHR